MEIRDPEAVEAMVARVIQEWGRVDVLVANAGGGRGRPMDTNASTLASALLQLVTEMNLFGTVYSCNAVAPTMKQQRSGKIITVSSVAGTAPSADGGYAHYGAAKAAIAHYTRYLAQDLGPFGITVNCIAPGVIATGRIMQTVIPGSSNSNRDRAEQVALRRLGTVEDCAKVVEFLATDLSDSISGAVIAIDGGLARSCQEPYRAFIAQADPLDLKSEMRSFIGHHTDKSFDWDAFPGSRGFPDLERAQMRYIGAGGSPKADAPRTLKTGQ